MDQRIINLYDEYTHKPLSRQEFLKRLSLLTGSMTAALSVLPSLESNYTVAATVSEAELFTERITYMGINNTAVQAYVARPKKKKQYSSVVVIHENRGLTPHIEDVARRISDAGYLAIAPNALSVLGAVPANEDDARQMFTKLNQAEVLQHFIKVFDYLRERNDVNGDWGCVGFCWGGAMSGKLAVNVPFLKAAVSFYGRQPELADVPKIKAAVQLHYAGIDEGVNAGMAAYEEALKKNNITYEQHIYEGAQHAFHNDTSTARYNKDAATLAWKRTLEFFNRHLEK